MRRRYLPIVITLAILAPGLIAGTWVAAYYSSHGSHRLHSAPHTTIRQTSTNARPRAGAGVAPLLSAG